MQETKIHPQAQKTILLDQKADTDEKLSPFEALLADTRRLIKQVFSNNSKTH